MEAFTSNRLITWQKPLCLLDYLVNLNFGLIRTFAIQIIDLV